MALDAHAHAGEGAKTLAAVARNLGATDEQIAETLRIAHMVSGMGSLAASGAAFRG